jgi:secondary thiamine-phosphate synthase enzyme
VYRQTLTVPTEGRGFIDLTGSIARVVAESRISTGLCHAFCLHTSASLILQENADPDVLRDLETWMSGAVQDGDPRFHHRDEGPDDMSGHVRTALTRTSLVLPVQDARLHLGTWQAVYLWEHRTAPHTRRVVLTVWG